MGRLVRALVVLLALVASCAATASALAPALRSSEREAAVAVASTGLAPPLPAPSSEPLALLVTTGALVAAWVVVGLVAPSRALAAVEPLAPPSSRGPPHLHV